MCGRRLIGKSLFARCSLVGCSHVSGLFCAVHMTAGPDEVREPGSDHDSGFNRPMSPVGRLPAPARPICITSASTYAGGHARCSMDPRNKSEGKHRHGSELGGRLREAESPSSRKTLDTVSVAGVTQAAYTYKGLEQLAVRVNIAGGSTTTHYVHDLSGNVIAETAGGGVRHQRL